MEANHDNLCTIGATGCGRGGRGQGGGGQGGNLNQGQGSGQVMLQGMDVTNPKDTFSKEEWNKHKASGSIFGISEVAEELEASPDKAVKEIAKREPTFKQGLSKPCSRPPQS